MHKVVSLEHFNSWDQLRKSSSSSKIHLLTWNSTRQAAPLEQWCWALLAYSLLIKGRGCPCAHFIIFIFCVWLVIDLKWSQRLSEDSLGKWRSDTEYTAVSLCVFCHFLHIHGRNGGENRCFSPFRSYLSQERGEPPAGGPLLLLHHDLESL